MIITSKIITLFSNKLLKNQQLIVFRKVLKNTYNLFLLPPQPLKSFSHSHPSLLLSHTNINIKTLLNMMFI